MKCLLMFIENLCSQYCDAAPAVQKCSSTEEVSKIDLEKMFKLKMFKYRRGEQQHTYETLPFLKIFKTLEMLLTLPH